MKKIFNIDKHRFLIILIILLYCISIYNVPGKTPDIYSTLKNVDSSNFYSTSKMINQVNKLQNFLDYSYLEEVKPFDGKFYLKNLNAIFNNRMIFAAFLALLVSSYTILLKQIRRAQYEETHLIHILLLMKDIHRFDGVEEICVRL